MSGQTKIAVLKERAAGETRVAATPETIKKFIALGAVMAVEQGAGDSASISDQAYRDAGAEVGPVEAVLKDADIVFGVQGPVELWWGIEPISAGVFGVPVGFAVVILVSLFTRHPTREVQALVERIRYPRVDGE